ncbi:hypothetical protein LuPra_02358 [Luteitalea pratensis]|uniref:Heme-binding protein n=1 Tax=Luteitalea pratensis TaxID=1855912 RepID=A0A143PKQ2_LUTPR|nr:heme-binding protein [Luteitalea pratensis]AMY09145.1 hypothetical protein LuPra_02358 [Luteitalea pratensis]
MTCKITLSLLLGVVLLPLSAHAQSDADCKNLPSHAQLKAAIDVAVGQEGSGLNLHMWATVVNRDGIVCAIAFSGTDRGAQWPGSRVISAQKASTANAFSLDSSAASGGSGGALALSTANLYSAVQPGGSLFGLQASNPVSTADAYKGPSDNYGQFNDPLVGEKVGGVNVFGGGLALYASVQNGPAQIVGGVGVSGDTSCADHNIAWRVRHNLELDYLHLVPGVAGLFQGDAAHPDNIIFDIVSNPGGGTGISPSGFGHPTCFKTVSGGLPAVR